MNHTRLTIGNFASLSATAFFIGMVTVGFGAVDLIMVAPFGVVQVAAVGQGDLIISCLFAGLLGLVDAFSAQMAAAEGGGKLRGRLASLSSAFVANAIIASALAVALLPLVEPALRATRQVDSIVEPVKEYVSVQLLSVFPMLVFFASNEALKITGMKGFAIWNLAAGLAANAGLNFCFLYTPLFDLFGSASQSVSVATSLAQVGMAVSGALAFNRRLRKGPLTGRANRQDIERDFLTLARIAPGIGARRLNDYASTVIPLLFIGTMTAEIIAAANVATKIFALFCRVPQACLTAAFIYYGYASDREAVGTSISARRRNALQLALYSAVQTAFAASIVLLNRDQIVNLFGITDSTSQLPSNILLAYLLIIPFYFLEQFFAELLVIHREAGILFIASSLVTYIISIPLAYIAVFDFTSPFLSIASKGIGLAILATTFWLTLRTYLRDTGGFSHAQ